MGRSAWGCVAAMGSLLAAAALSACGSPDGPVEEFTFTPEPYFFMPSASKMPYAISVGTNSSERWCDLYRADLVSALVRPEQLESLVNWAEGRGFQATYNPEIRADPSTPERAGEPTREPLKRVVAISVPRGSVNAALPLILEQPGVVAAERSGFVYIDFSPTCPALREPDWYCTLSGLDQVTVRIERERYPPLRQWLADQSYAVIREQDNYESLSVEPDAPRLSTPRLMTHLLIAVPADTARAAADLLASQPAVAEARPATPEERWSFPTYRCG